MKQYREIASQVIIEQGDFLDAFHDTSLDSGKATDESLNQFVSL